VCLVSNERVPIVWGMLQNMTEKKGRRQGCRQARATFGSFRMARARAMRCFCPPDTCAPFSPACVSYLHTASKAPGIINT
jgi:hypothetical protein